MTSRIEAAIQRALVDWFNKTYCEAMLQATLNENSRHATDMGIVVGITDLIIFARKDGILHVFFHELKTKKGKLSDSQVDWFRDYYSKKLISSNTHYEVSYGLSQAKKEIAEWMLKFIASA